MLRFAQKEANKNIILEYVAKVQKYDSSYTAPTTNTSSGGCYVATAVYGSYDCPQVWTLRRYRDYTLAETWYGRMFIRTYYAISPTLVKWFGNTEWFKRMWRGKLDRMVENLQKNGVRLPWFTLWFTAELPDSSGFSALSFLCKPCKRRKKKLVKQ